MADKDRTFEPLTSSVVKGLNDKLYEKRKTAALEIEKLVKQLATSDDSQRIMQLTAVLRKEFVFSSNANSRKGGLIGLAATAIALGQQHQNISSYLSEFVPPVLSCFIDLDSRVRYYACESMYNIAKVARGDVLIFFNRIFDCLSKLAADADPGVKNGAELLDRLIKDIVTESPTFDIQKFIPLLTERIYSVNPHTRQFIVSWLTVLDSVPDIDLLGYLPNFLDGLFKILSDPEADIRRSCEAVLYEFLKEIKTAENVNFAGMVDILLGYCSSDDQLAKLLAMTWLNEFIILAKKKMLPFTAQILDPVLVSLAMEVEANIREMATACNQNLMKLIAEDSAPFQETGEEAFVLFSTLSILSSQLQKEVELSPSLVEADLAQAVPTRIAALRWILMLHRRLPDKFFELIGEIGPSLLRTLSDPADRVVVLDLEVFSELSSSPAPSAAGVAPTGPGPNADAFFNKFLVDLLVLFRSDRELLERRGAFIIRQLCTLLTAEKIYQAMAAAVILLKEDDLEFACLMVQNLNIILLTATELFGLRKSLQGMGADIRPLFCILYRTWCHSPIATLALCLLGQVYDHACELLLKFSDLEVTVAFLVEIDKLVQLLESPIFTALRLQLLEPQRHAYLIKCLYGLLMLLPQSAAFNTLRQRLDCVPTIIHSLKLLDENSKTPALTQKGNIGLPLPFADLLAHFQAIQARHAEASRAALRAATEML